MSFMKLNITWDEDLITERTHNRLVRDLLRMRLTKHRDQTLRKHFEPGAESRYPIYEQRKKSYQIAKARKWHHQKPLVWSGRMQREIISSSKITATKGRARLIARNYFPMKKRRRQEIETINKQEQAEIAADIGRGYRILAHSKQYRRKRRRKA